MTTLINSATPFLRILLPDETYAQFQAGKLEIDKDDTPFFDAIMAEAIRNPSIAIIENETTCRFCGEVFTGKKAADHLADHGKEVHFDLWVKQQEIEAATVIAREVKARAGFICDVCSPIQTFGSAEDLAAHANLLHTAPPPMDDQGNTIGGGDDDRRPGEVEPAPAARRSRRADSES